MTGRRGIAVMSVLTLVTGCTQPCVCSGPKTVVVQQSTSVAGMPAGELVFDAEVRRTERQAAAVVLRPSTTPEVVSRLTGLRAGLAVARQDGDGPRARAALRSMQEYLQEQERGR